MSPRIRRLARTLRLLILLTCALQLQAQELEPRAYVVSPIGVSGIVYTFNSSFGEVNFDPSLAVEESSATLYTNAIGYLRSINVFGRTGTITVVAPYTFGELSGIVEDQFVSVRRSGLRDPTVRFGVNLFGGPAMNFKEFAQYRQKTNIGASVKIVVPLGQYDPARLISEPRTPACARSTPRR
jgi:hypothetical protein